VTTLSLGSFYDYNNWSIAEPYMCVSLNLTGKSPLGLGSSDMISQVTVLAN